MLPHEMGANDRTLNVVGESYRNPDGSSRQEEIRRCKPGERIELRREPDNEYDEMAVAVYSARGVQVGYLAVGRSEWIGGMMDSDQHVNAVVERRIGGTPDKPNLGLQIRLNVSGDQPEAPLGDNYIGERKWFSRLFGL